MEAALLSYLTTIQAVLFDILSPFYANSEEGGLSAPFSNLLSTSRIRRLHSKSGAEIDFPWVCYFLDLLNESRIYNEEGLELFVKMAQKEMGVNESKFLEWLSQHNFTPTVRTIQQQRNKLVHKQARDGTPIDFAAVSLIDAFWHHNLKEIV